MKLTWASQQACIVSMASLRSNVPNTPPSPKAPKPRRDTGCPRKEKVDVRGLEFVIRDVARAHTKGGEHSGTGRDHRGRTAEVILNRPGMVVTLEVLRQHDLVNRAGRTDPCVLERWRRERQVERKIRMGAGKCSEVVVVENLLPRARAVPEAHL